MAASGLPDGAYSLGGLDVTVSDRAARLTGSGSLAGGVSTLVEQVRWLHPHHPNPHPQPHNPPTTTPPPPQGLPGVGSLSAGFSADVLVVDESLSVQRVLRRGAWL
jgi:N-acetylglucosamine-6-phosphate deacetylase